MSGKSPRETAEDIVAARLENEGSSKAGLDKLQKEYQSCLAAQGRQQTDAYFDKVLNELDNKTLLRGIATKSIADRVRPGQVVDGSLLVFPENSSNTLSDLNRGSGLDELLAKRFKPHPNDYDSSRRWGLLSISAISDKRLDAKVDEDDFLCREKQVGWWLQSSGTFGPLWKVLRLEQARIDKDAKDQISLDLLEQVAARSRVLKLSPAQIEAVQCMRDKWDSPEMVELRKHRESKFVPLNPLDRLNPSYGMNPLNRAKPWNYQRGNETTRAWFSVQDIEDKTGLRILESK